MAIYAICECGKPLSFKDDAAGRRVKCPACGAMLTVPGRAAGPEPAISTPLASVLEQAAVTEKTAKRVRASAPAATNAAKVIFMAILGVMGAAVTVGIIVLACMLASGPEKPAGKAAVPAATVSIPPAPEAPAVPPPTAPAAEQMETPVTPPAAAATEPTVPPIAPPTTPAPVEPAAPAPLVGAMRPPEEAPAAAPPEVAPAAAPAEPNLPPEKEQEALRLLKKPTSVSVSYTTLSAADDETNLNRAVEFARTFILRKGPADGLRPAAEEIAKFSDRAKFVITVLADAGPDLETLQKIVGKEGHSEAKEFYRKGGPDARSRASLVDAPEPTDLPVTWRHYGWLAFGEVGGKVVAVRADCRRLR